MNLCGINILFIDTYASYRCINYNEFEKRHLNHFTHLYTGNNLELHTILNKYRILSM